MYNLSFINILIFLSVVLEVTSILLIAIGFMLHKKVLKNISFAANMLMYISLYSAWLHYVSLVTAFNGYIVMFYSCLLILYFFYRLSLSDKKAFY